MSYSVNLKALDEITLADATQLSSETINTSYFEVYFVTSDGYIGDEGVATTREMVRAHSTIHQFWASQRSSETSGDNFDLSKIYVLGTNGNKVRVQYLKGV